MTERMKAQGGSEAADYGEYELSWKEKSLFGILGYAGFFFLMMVFYNDLLLAAAGGLLCIFCLPLYRKFLLERRKSLLEAQFRDFLYAVSSSAAAGRQLDAALADAEKTLLLLYPADSPLCTELAMINRSVKEGRDDIGVLLANLARRSGSEDIRDFVDVCNLCRQLGADLEEVIENTSRVMTDKMAVRREILTLTAQKKLEGRIISVMPIVVISGLNLFSPDYLEVLYTTFAGRLIMTLALLGIAVSYWMMQRLLAIEV